jgi:hypothetical protein
MKERHPHSTSGAERSDNNEDEDGRIPFPQWSLKFKKEEEEKEEEGNTPRWVGGNY